MKTKTAKQPKHSKPAVHLKDIKPKKNPAGGAVQGSRNGNLQIADLTSVAVDR